jgi:hypothetical protein
MTSVTMIAMVFGPYLAILGLWMLLFGDQVSKVTAAIKNSPAALYGTSIWNLLIGLFLINSFNVWSAQMIIFVTLLGWFMFVRGVLGLYMPHVVVNTILAPRHGAKVLNLVVFIWGLLLIWLGFFM